MAYRLIAEGPFKDVHQDWTGNQICLKKFHTTSPKNSTFMQTFQQLAVAFLNTIVEVMNCLQLYLSVALSSIISSSKSVSSSFVHSSKGVSSSTGNICDDLLVKMLLLSNMQVQL